MKKSVKIVVFVLSLCTVICGGSERAYAGAAWEIENILDVSECRQGDTVTMSVNLKDASADTSQEMAFVSMSGTLEYDTSCLTLKQQIFFLLKYKTYKNARLTVSQVFLMCNIYQIES